MLTSRLLATVRLVIRAKTLVVLLLYESFSVIRWGFRCHFQFGHLMRIIVVPARRATRPLIEHAPEASYREFCQVYSVIVIQFDLRPSGHSFSNPFPYRLSSATVLLCLFVPLLHPLLPDPDHDGCCALRRHTTLSLRSNYIGC